MNFRRQRIAMIETQIKARGIDDPRVIEAMRAVPRHRFVPAKLRLFSYEDRPLAIGSGQTISQPFMVALMTQMLRLRETDHVLEVGTGSGYQTAILASIAASVVTIERHANLADRAQRVLEELEFTNVTVIEGDGTLGYADAAPYDAILVTAAGPHVPQPLGEQLAVGGRLVCPVGSREAQKVVRIVRTPDGLVEDEGIPCMFVPLIGEEGWQEEVD